MERIPARREAITSQGGRALAGPDRHGSGAAPALNQKLELISSHEFDRAGQVRIDDDGGFSRIKANLDRDGHARSARAPTARCRCTPTNFQSSGRMRTPIEIWL